jgi:hypothetical protein
VQDVELVRMVLTAFPFVRVTWTLYLLAPDTEFHLILQEVKLLLLQLEKRQFLGAESGVTTAAPALNVKIPTSMAAARKHER